MPNLTLLTIALMIVFVLPGFVINRIYRQAVARPLPQGSEVVLESFMASCFYYAFVGPLAIVLLGDDKLLTLARTPPSTETLLQVFGGSPTTLAMLALGVTLVGPLFAGWFAAWGLGSPLVDRILSLAGFLGVEPRPGTRSSTASVSTWCWLRSKTGSRVGGYWYVGSFAGSHPHKNDLYLQRQYDLGDGGAFLRPSDPARGCWIAGDEIRTLELIQIRNPPTRMRRPTQ
ncbi:MAG: hypothetical protein IPK07_24800 [Deltaproteobacteria bacterium]|nr:hypothetical protein [Deltaproteobacteria bacterium]